MISPPKRVIIRTLNIFPTAGADPANGEHCLWLSDFIPAQLVEPLLWKLIRAGSYDCLLNHHETQQLKNVNKRRAIGNYCPEAMRLTWRRFLKEVVAKRQKLILQCLYQSFLFVVRRRQPRPDLTGSRLQSAYVWLWL
jgi:hypothetical protein